MAKYMWVWLCIASLALGSLPASALSQTHEIAGSMAGKVFDKNARIPIPDVTVRAQRITTNESFTGLVTDGRGSYMISPVPPGIYVFYLECQGVEYAVGERFDVRAGMDFLLETCFQLDPKNRTAELIRDCDSGVYAENQIVSLGPHRFYLPFNQPGTEEQEVGEGEAVAAQAGVIVDHAGVDCLTNDYFPVLSAVIQPADFVQSSRIYFRAAQHPDFYYVVMRRGVMTEANLLDQTDGDIFTGILPKPSPDTQRIIYYIEAIDLDFNMSQSEEHAPDVTDHDHCQRRDPAAAYFTGEDPGIVVGATVAGAAAVPLGFEAAGIAGFISAAGAVSTVAAVGAAAAGGAGLGAAGTVLVVAGATAAAGGVVSGVTGEEEASKVR